ncbi:MAG: FAD-dependent oxidoreductase [Anaerolinea sp.]|nr:FAD-dependent oxidoreductase [Anaerolinea sp.]HRI56250.1 FAD-dependent oxidoreductase [Anaerolineae bacterium]
MPTRYCIVGQGVAGIAAAQAIRAADAAGPITLISDDPHGYYSRPGLAYYLTGEIQRGHLFPWREQEFQQLGLHRVLGRAISLNPAEHRLWLANNVPLVYDRLLLATGASAVRPTLPGSDLPQVIKLDNLADADQMLALARRAQSAVVVGGGITALEIVEGLRQHCRRVHYLLRGQRYWSNVLDEAEARLVMQRLAAEGVRIHTHSELAAIEAKRGRVAAVLTTAGQRIACDLVAIAIGVAPRAELAQAAGLAVARGILVDETLRTSDPDIFAAGDVAQVFDPRAGKALLDTLWNSARSHGHTAGQNMAGGALRYVKPMPLNVTRLAGITTTIIGAVGAGRDADLIGIARGDSELWRELGQALVAEEEHEVNRLRLLVGLTTLVGAVLMGDQRLSRPLQRLIGEQIDITPIRSQLLTPDAPLASLLTRFAEGVR